MSFKKEIDFFEYSFLLESCIPSRPIARSMFWNESIRDYDLMSKEERRNLHKWICRHYSMEKGLEDRVEECLIWEARFNPDNQYIVKANYEGNQSTQEAFLYEGKYWVGKDSYIGSQFIESVEKI